MIYTALATAYELTHDHDRAVEAFQMLIQHGRSSANLLSELLGSAGLALMAMRRGRLCFAFEVASQAIERVERSGSLPPISQAVYGEMGEIYYQWHQLELAHKHFQRALALMQEEAPAEASGLAQRSSLRGWRVTSGPLWLTIEGRTATVVS